MKIDWCYLVCAQMPRQTSQWVTSLLESYFVYLANHNCLDLYSHWSASYMMYYMFVVSDEDDYGNEEAIERIVVEY